MSDYQTIEVGSLAPLTATVVNRNSGLAITSGTVNYYLYAHNGTNAGKWWRASDNTWQASETANAASHVADGAWTSGVLSNSPFADGVYYRIYFKESGGLHVPTGWTVKAEYTPAADSSRRMDLSKIVGQAVNDPGGSVTVPRILAADGAKMDLINAPNAVAIAAIQNGLATQADINALNQSASRRIILTAVEQFERPESGTTSYTVEARTYDGDGAAVNADSTPTLTATGIISGSLAANLSAASNPSTGVYRWTYTVADDAAVEQLRFDVSAVMGSTFTLTKYAQVTDFVAATFTTADRDKLTAIQTQTDLIGTDDADSPAAQTAQTNAATAATQATAANAKLLGNVAGQTGDAFARLGAPAGASVSADIAAVKSDSGAIAAILSGITSLPKWLRTLFRKNTPDATALGEINSGGGSYDATTDSAEAMAEAIATVDATAGSAPTTTEIWTHAQRSLTDGAIRVVSPFQSGSFAIVRGDSYLNADGNARSFGKVDGATWPTDLTGWTITFTCNPTDDLLAADPDAIGFSATGTVVTATGDSQAVRVDFTSAQTATLSVEDGGYKYDVQASSGNSRATLETGYMAVLEDQTTG